MIRVLYIFIFMLFLLGSGSLTLKGQNETFHTVSVENGLSNNFIRKIYKDSRGFTWVGTLNGLDRFDGISFKSYTTDNEQEITIYDMIETDPNSLWLGSNNGLWKFSYDSEKLIKTSFSEGKQFLCLGKDSKNNLIAGTSNGFYIISDEQPRFVPLNYHSEQQITIQGIYPDENQTCWLSTSGGLYFCDYSTNEPLLTKYNSNITNNFQAIQKDGPTIYLGTRGFGIIRFDILSKQFTKYIDVGNDNILLLSKDNYNNLWVGTDGGGLIKISISKNKVTGSYRHDIQNTNSIASNAVYSFLEDNDMLWVGTYSNGLSYTINRLFKTYSFGSFSTKNLRVRSLYVRDNDKFIGSRDGFFYINDNKGIIESFTIGKPNSKHLSSNTIIKIFPYKDKFLLGTLQGLRVFDPEHLSITEFNSDQIFKSGNFYDFDMDDHNNIWMATFNGVIRVSPNGDAIRYTRQNSSLPENILHSIQKDRQGRIWIGMKGGVCYYDPTSDLFRKAEILPHSIDNCKITDIYIDRNSFIWFCTESDGLYRIDSNLTSYEHYTTENFLPDNAVTSIMEDELGYFWVATHKGLIRCTFADNMNQAYGLSDGLPGLMFNPGACYYDSKTKQFWWGNEDGLVYCNIEDLKTNEKPPPIQIIRFYVNGKEIATTTAILPKAIEMTSKIKLRQFENSFGFDFVALNYRHPNDNNFETKLDGLDKDWQLLKKGNTSVYYGGISPGKYTFNVRLMGYPESEKSITITVQRNWKVVIWLIPTLLLFFLYIVLWKKSKNNPSRKTTPQKERAVNNSIQIKDHSIKYNELLHLMQEKKPYLDPELKMPYLTGVLKCSSKELSEIFRDHIKQSFADFVNGYRIKEFKEKIEKGEHEKYTIIALSERCGFSSRSSFFRIFKKLTGSTPLEYLKQIEREPN